MELPLVVMRQKGILCVFVPELRCRSTAEAEPKVELQRRGATQWNRLSTPRRQPAQPGGVWCCFFLSATLIFGIVSSMSTVCEPPPETPPPIGDTLARRLGETIVHSPLWYRAHALGLGADPMGSVR